MKDATFRTSINTNFSARGAACRDARENQAAAFKILNSDVSMHFLPIASARLTGLQIPHLVNDSFLVIISPINGIIKLDVEVEVYGDCATAFNVRRESPYATTEYVKDLDAAIKLLKGFYEAKK